MANKELKARIQLRRGTDAFFTSENKQLLNGEIFLVDVDNVVKVKIGNGTDTYSNLPFYDRDLLKILGVDLADDNSIIFLDDEQKLSIKGYNDATQGQMLVKDVNDGLAWINPLSDETLRAAVAAAEAAKVQAGNYASQSGSSAADAAVSAQQAERINQVTMEWVNSKFWWGTLEEYNALEEITEGTYYFVEV